MRFVLRLSILAAGLCALPSALAETRAYAIAGFTQIEADSAFEIEFTQAKTYSVVVDSQYDTLDKVIVEKRGKALRITRPPGRIDGRVRDIVRVTAPDLDVIDLRSAVTFKAPSLKADTLEIDVDSAVSVTISNLQADRVDVRADSAAKVQLSGTCGRIHADLGAATSLRANDLKCKSAAVKTGEAAFASVHATERVDARAGTASSVKVSGNPAEFEKSSAFTGSVKSEN